MSAAKHPATCGSFVYDVRIIDDGAGIGCGRRSFYEDVVVVAFIGGLFCGVAVAFDVQGREILKRVRAKVTSQLG